VDANATTQGTSTARACSRAKNASGAAVLPWSNVSWAEADAACRISGMRLCKVTRMGGVVVTDEWGFACQAGQTCSAGYPYSCTYSATTCNASDMNLGKAVPCGSLASCATTGDLDTATTTEHVYDMSGNLAEWTDDRRDVADTTVPSAGAGSATSIYTTRGGAFDSFYRGAACDFTGTELYATFSYADTGFRCCSSCAPGKADCNGTCANLASDAANCGACGKACAAGTSCQNGVCK
jgi:formylglycine-generating enzyme required for sulfatase activity